MKDQVLALSAQGKTQRAIAAELNTSPAKVNRILQKARGAQAKASTWHVPRPLKPGDLLRVIRAAVAAKVSAEMVQRALPYFTVAEAQEMLDSVDDDAFWASPA